jgi:predicted ATP-dependent Lon-type protease
VFIYLFLDANKYFTERVVPFDFLQELAMDTPAYMQDYLFAHFMLNSVSD